MKTEMIELSEKDFENATKAKANTGYLGAGDPLLDLGKASSFAYENKTCRVFGLLYLIVPPKPLDVLLVSTKH